MKTILTFFALLIVTTGQAQSNYQYVKELGEMLKSGEITIPTLPGETLEANERDGCDDLPDSIISRIWYLDEWEIDERRIFLYDEERRLISESYENTTFGTTPLTFVEKQQISYSGNQSVNVISIYDAMTASFQPDRRVTETLEDDLLILAEEERIDDNGEWVINSKTDYFYNELNSVTEVRYSFWDPINADYLPFTRFITDYTIVDGVSLIDSFYQQRIVAYPDQWENYGIRFDYERDEQQRIQTLEVGSYINEEEVLMTVYRLEYAYDETGDNFTTFAYNLAEPDFEELALNEKTINYFENGLNVIDSVFRYNAETMGFDFEYLADFEYDIALRNYLRTNRYVSETDPEELENATQTETYYQLCLSNTEEELTATADCNFANPMLSGQNGTCYWQDNTEATLTLYDLLGRPVMQQPIYSGAAFSFGTLPTAGVYLMVVESENELLLQRKVVVGR